MGNIRKAAVAGTFYHAAPDKLRSYINDLLDQAIDQPSVGKAIIAPHAGHIYSGPIAASAYRSLRRRRLQINKVVLMGPSHYVGFMGIATSTAEHYETPLGLIPLDKTLTSAALEIQEVVTMDHAHLQEHSLEVHLPFLQEALGDFTLLPLIIGDTSEDTIAEVLDKVWGDEETLIICSTDLSHYLNYQDALAKDLATIKNICSFNMQNMDHHNACGMKPIKGLLKAAKRKKLISKIIDLRNSGDTAGDKERVVGYASLLLDEAQKMAMVFSREEQQAMLQFSRSSLKEKLLGQQNENSLKINLPEITAACFITLTQNNLLRGCIGSLTAHRDLKIDIIENTFSAAFKDPRFPTLKAKELKNTSIAISILTKPEVINFSSEQDLLNQLSIGYDGLILTEGSKRSTFLPSVWQELATPELFLNHLKQKAGLPAGYWSKTIQIERYNSIYICETQFN